MPQFYFINKDSKSAQLSKSGQSEQAAIQRYVQTGRKRPRPKKKPVAELPTLPMKSFTADPFDASSVKLDSTISGLIHYYVYYYHPVLWPNEMAVLKAGMYTFHDAVKSILKTIVANEMMMYCLLSAASCRMNHIDHLPSGAVKKEGEYISNALRLMSKRVASTEFQQVLTCIMFLMAADSYRHEMDGARLHLQAAYRLLKPLGGITAIEDEALQGQLAMGDLFIACIDLEPCLFDCSYNPGPASSLNLSTDDLSPYQPLARSFGLSLRRHIDQLAESYSIKRRLRVVEMGSERAMLASRWITKRCMAIRNELLGLKLHGSDHALRVALIMWSLLAMNVTGRSRTVKVMAPNLQMAMKTDWTDLALRKWIFLVGFQCSDVGSATAHWFACQLYEGCCPLLKDKDALAKQMEEFQQDYFYDEAVQRPRTQALAVKLLAMQQQH